ncbi:SMI1/KNR4 family protein [Hymenobacter lutimineralis]|uniref:SMI1/KNR4 family protein n=1 Tax=Hymenobacter lutimineralis TaxID=2606448 RepID=A0A5D6VFC2_9BACT|nr:SMI1/KNR4 family protein [Hymenobacter lutimineralis]TYZ13274.1 SMI1/KNR4 family protein [Hymenobacter lutimineralis]
MFSLPALLQQIQDARKRLDVEFHLNETQSCIAEVEARLNRRLPEEIRAFYAQCPGFWTNDGLFRVLSMADILVELEVPAATSSNTKRHFPVADYMIFSDVWEVVLDEGNSARYVIVNSNHHTEEPVVLTDSLYEFINKFLREGVFEGEEVEGLYGWRKRLKKLSQ